MMQEIGWLGAHLPQLDFVKGTGRAIVCIKCRKLIQKVSEADSYQEVFRSVEMVLSHHRKYAVELDAE